MQIRDNKGRLIGELTTRITQQGTVISIPPDAARAESKSFEDMFHVPPGYRCIDDGCTQIAAIWPNAPGHPVAVPNISPHPGAPEVPPIRIPPIRLPIRIPVFVE